MDNIITLLIEKVCNTLGLLFYPMSAVIRDITENKRSLRKLQNKYDISLREEILNRKMDDITKASIISALSKPIKEFVNQTRILGIAIDNLKDTAKPEMLDDDWLYFFMNKGAAITNEQMIYIYGERY